MTQAAGEQILKIPVSVFESAETKEELEEKVREVVIHEVGHYFGLDEARLRELEEE